MRARKKRYLVNTLHITEMVLQLKDWAKDQKVWDDLCQKGELYSIEHVEKETGISKNELINVIKQGVKVKNHQNHKKTKNKK